jgi:CheY-like chemotaxis protein
VTDTGCGIDPKNLQKIFEPFFSTKEMSKGTGLGLATVYGIVKQHHGWIEVQSQLGVGTTFKILLPGIKKASAFATEIVARTDAIRGGKEALLLVEDETGLRELVQQILQEYQYNVVVASSGVEALKLWEQYDGQFDLLLTDMVMPGGMTGQDLATELKKRKPNLKVVYSSGYSSELIGKDFGTGNTAFLAKPYMPRQLARLVRECLDKPLKDTDAPVPDKAPA